MGELNKYTGKRLEGYNLACELIRHGASVKQCGNAVCPPIPAALVRANLPELCTGKRMPICRNDRLQQEKTGQLRFA